KKEAAINGGDWGNSDDSKRRGKDYVKGRRNDGLPENGDGGEKGEERKTNLKRRGKGEKGGKFSDF
ncbi:hypothetical protein L195_g058636, partial [Trifolium pratense]